MKIVVADDHALVRQGLVGLLQMVHPEWILEEADTLDAGLLSLSRAPADLLVLDLDMPGMDGVKSLPALREAYPETRIAILTGTEERDVILECLAAGVHGYVLKSQAVDQLVFAIEALLKGQIYVPPALSRLIQSEGAPPAPTSLKKIGLTPRQVEVLQLLAEGRSTKDIARRLNLGVGTVKVHLAGVYRALGAQSRMEAVVKASKYKFDA